MDTKYVIGFIIGIAVILGGVIVINNRSQGPVSTVDLSSFVQCLKDKKVTFYGAFWCPHCQATKKMFGTSAKNLPYVECSTPDGNGQTQVCKDAGISSYPTWQFADGSRISGEHSLQELSDRSGCVLPAEAQSTPSSPAQSEASSSAATTVQIQASSTAQ